MAFVTYVLLIGYVKGTNNKFTPEVLIQAIWSCLLLQFVEAGLMKFGLSLLQVTLPFLDLLSYTGYKYISLCLVTVCLSLSSTTVYFVASLYAALSVAFFVMRCMSKAIPASVVSTAGPPRHIVILVFALMQFVVTGLLCYL
jgi:protein transport protein YIF1